MTIQAAQLLPAVEVPQPHRSVEGGRGGDPAIRGDGDGVNERLVSGAFPQLAAVGQVPEADGVVVASRDGPEAVWGEGGAGYRLLVATHDLEFLAVGRVPQSHRIVAGRRTAAGRQGALAVRREGNAANPIAMSSKAGQLGPRVGVPDTGRFVLAARENASPMRRKGHALDRPLVALELP